MPRDKTESHIRIIAAAKAEFMEYGYEDASMRRIGERAGLTAAGVYRHCRDKADLFDQLVSPAAEDMKAWMKQHVSGANEALGHAPEQLWSSTWVNLMRDLVYPRMEEYRLLLTRSQGTAYEDFLHDIVSENQDYMMDALQALRALGYPVQDISPKELHLLLSGYMTAMFEPVIHGYPMDEALRCLNLVETFFMPGWKQLMGF